MSAWSLFKATCSLRMFAWAKIPLIAIVRPRILMVNEQECQVRVPLNWVTGNHVGSMYFGALSIGADLAGGWIVMNMIRERRSRATFLFKDMSAEFLKRAEGPVVFTCRDGDKMKALLDNAETSGRRVDDTVEVVATVPTELGATPVATFKMTISLRARPA